MKQLYLLAFFALLGFALMPATADAASLEYYGIQDIINSDLTTNTNIGLQFAEPITHLDFNLDFRVYNLTAKANFDSADCNVSYNSDRSTIACDFVGMTVEKNFLTLDFTTKGRVSKSDDGYQFASEYDISVPVNESFVIIKLPENSILMKEVANESFSPGDGKLGSDGRHITVHWERNNLQPGDDLKFSVLYTMPFGGPFFNIMIVSITGVVLVVMMGLAIYIRRGGPSELPTKEEVVSSVLTTDENTIVDILKRNNGEAMQKVLVRDTNFSKAKVSRYVKTLSERGVLRVEPLGRTNKIRLVMDKEESAVNIAKKEEPQTPPAQQTQPAQSGNNQQNTNQNNSAV